MAYAEYIVLVFLLLFYDAFLFLRYENLGYGTSSTNAYVESTMELLELKLKQLFRNKLNIDMMISICCLQADSIAEKIGYASYILNNTALDEDYKNVSNNISVQVHTIGYTGIPILFKLAQWGLICRTQN